MAHCCGGGDGGLRGLSAVVMRRPVLACTAAVCSMNDTPAVRSDSAGDKRRYVRMGGRMANQPGLIGGSRI
jgi:hypothetical protein